MIFEELTDNKVTQDDFLWRYLSLHKFISLVSNKKLIFSRLDLLQDPFEGVRAQLIKDRFLNRLTSQDNIVDSEIKKGDNSKMIAAFEKTILDQYNNQVALLNQKSQFVNCWFIGDRESMAMWNVYSNSTGVAIKINARIFVDYTHLCSPGLQPPPG